MMLTPALTTAVLFKNKETSYLTFSQDAAYLLSPENKWFDIAKRSIECTKKPMALKVFFMIKSFGEDIFEKYIDQTYELAREFAELIKRTDDFELATEPESNIVCFRLKHNELTEQELNKLNTKVREKIIRSGKFYLVQTSFNGQIYLRITIMNPFTNKKILKNLLTEIWNHASSKEAY